MYTIDHRDTVVELEGVPQPSAGAPCPILLANNHFLCVAYEFQEHVNWNDYVPEEGEKEFVGLISFVHPCAHMFGPPNDETWNGHPLADRGLTPYGVYEVLKSSWIRSLERMNSVHPRHQPERFDRYRHFIFAFHDDIFECVAESFTSSLHVGSVESVIMSVLTPPNSPHP